MARPGVRGTFSQPGPSRPAVAVRLARTLGVTKDTMRAPSTLRYRMTNAALWRFRLVGALVAAYTSVCSAQEMTRSGQLFDALAAMDKELFDAAFVNCDSSRFRALFTDDAEFYHDRTGLAAGEVRACKARLNRYRPPFSTANSPLPGTTPPRSAAAPRFPLLVPTNTGYTF